MLAKVDDATGRVTEAWTGPQVAWTMARGRARGRSGARSTTAKIWWSLTAVFFLGLANLRRPLSLRNLDLLVLLSFSASWWFFNEGEIFTSVPLAYPPLVYLLAPNGMGRAPWRGTAARRTDRCGPCGLLAALTIFLAGFRIGLNVEASNVIDVGYAGVIGAQRIVDQGEMPYGHMPVHEGEECGPPDSNGNVRDRIQTNGRCESANDRGDTYGPINYIAYIPGYLAYGWSGKWDDLPAAHFTALLFDSLDADRARARRVALRPGASGGDAFLCLGRVPVHAVRVELERERRPPAVPARLRLLARDVGARARSVRRPGLLGQVRLAAAGARCGPRIRTA